MIDWIDYFNNESNNNIKKFMPLWLQCNDYCNNKYGHDGSDKAKFLKLKNIPEINDKYDTLKNKFLSSFNSLQINNQPRTYVVNMKRKHERNFYTSEQSDIEHFLKVIYQIRCNYFHGGKQPVSDDLNLISWAYESLNDLLTGTIF